MLRCLHMSNYWIIATRVLIFHSRRDKRNFFQINSSQDVKLICTKTAKIVEKLDPNKLNFQARYLPKIVNLWIVQLMPQRIWNSLSYFGLAICTDPWWHTLYILSTSPCNSSKFTGANSNKRQDNYVELILTWSQAE